MGYQTGFGALIEQQEDAAFLKTYRGMLDRIDVHDVLRHYDAQNVQTETPRGEIIHSCLIDKVDPHHSHGDSVPSAAINSKKKVYVCHSYGGGSLLWLIDKMEGGDRSSVSKVLRQFVSADPLSSEDMVSKVLEIFESEEEDMGIPFYNNRILDHWLALHPYLTEERGFDPDVMKKMLIGYDDKNVRIVIPHFWKGKLVGWQKRRLDADPRWPATPWIPKSETDGTLRPPEKYKNSTGFPKNTTLYNFDNAEKGKPVVVVESCPSVWRGIEYGMNIVSTFGAKVTKSQISTLNDHFSKVIIFFDGDSAGLGGALNLANGLAMHGSAFKIVPWSSDKDLADLTLQEANDAVDSAVPGGLGIKMVKEMKKEKG